METEEEKFKGVSIFLQSSYFHLFGYFGFEKMWNDCKQNFFFTGWSGGRGQGGRGGQGGEWKRGRGGRGGGQKVNPFGGGYYQKTEYHS